MSTSELAWFKSSYSSGSGDNCIEVAVRPATIHVRDSKAKQGPQLALSPTAWSAFVTCGLTIARSWARTP
ncbi:DUF397 domain-containing protein [Streptomyces alanosinicus]|uniref:Toxin n=1 Tax=Streptomyces alanosinicus TaxID=68171 RepID=A0A918YBY0_9ACTN|nr:DUF397 domain-containing protein [Streptomyces alanosinicus]GHD98435.1 toxin [Streptomyces alanosinicus]